MGNLKLLNNHGAITFLKFLLPQAACGGGGSGGGEGGGVTS